MCYDMCLRALDDAIQTFGSMKYRKAGENEASDRAAGEVRELVAELTAIRNRLNDFEGAHLDETVKCNACNVYRHHDHVKTEWRGAASKGGYDDDVKWAVRADGSRYAMKPSSPYARS